MGINRIIEDLEEQIALSDRIGEDPDDASWNYEIGVLLSSGDALRVVKVLKQAVLRGEVQE